MVSTGSGGGSDPASIERVLDGSGDGGMSVEALAPVAPVGAVGAMGSVGSVRSVGSAAGALPSGDDGPATGLALPMATEVAGPSGLRTGSASDVPDIFSFTDATISLAASVAVLVRSLSTPPATMAFSRTTSAAVVACTLTIAVASWTPSRACCLPRSTTYFGLTRSTIASIVTASSSRVRSMSLTSWSVSVVPACEVARCSAGVGGRSGDDDPSIALLVASSATCSLPGDSSRSSRTGGRSVLSVRCPRRLAPRRARGTVLRPHRGILLHRALDGG